MNTSRRTFIKTSSITIVGAAMLPPNILRQQSTDHVLGLQLYSVRDDMEKDPAGTLKRLAEMGYKHVEHAGYQDRKFYGYSIRILKSF